MMPRSDPQCSWRLPGFTVVLLLVLVSGGTFQSASDRSPISALRPAAPPELGMQKAEISTPEGATAAIHRQPIAFVENQGQWNFPASYVARMGPMTVFLEDRGWIFTLVERRENPRDAVDPTAHRDLREYEPVRGVALRMRFENGAAPAIPIPEQRLCGVHHYFLGNDPSHWRSNVPRHGAVVLADLYPGIDVRARSEGGHFEYDLLADPGADPTQVVVEIEGAEGLRIDGDGHLVIDTVIGTIRHPRPRSWQVDARGRDQQLRCGYVLLGGLRFGFSAPGWNREWTLVVDPGLVYSTFLGGSNGDRACGVALDATGAPTVCGYTQSPDFPTSTGAFAPTMNGGSWTAFVTRLDPSGTALIYSTYLGGSSPDWARALSLDANGATAVAGRTTSSDFPTMAAAFDTTYDGGGDAFVSKLDPSGGTLLYSTFLGGSDSDEVKALALDATGAVTVSGPTSSADFPTVPGSFDMTYNLGGDAFVSRLDPSGSALLYSTYLGGSNGDEVHALALDATGATTLAGQTSSANFPVTPGAFDTTHNNISDAFVARLDPTGSVLLYSTYVGGLLGDAARAVVLDAAGTPTVAGDTSSSDFPVTAGAFDTTHNLGSSHDAFVMRLDAAGSTLVYSTYLGGSDHDKIYALDVDATLSATIAGKTTSSDFPTTPGAFDATFNGGTGDIFVARLDPSGSALVYSSYLGGSAFESIEDLALHPSGAATACGVTYSSNFPITAGALVATSAGPYDAFVTRLDMLPTGASAYGSSTPGCAGFLPIGVNSWPQVGNTGFSLTCGNAYPGMTGVLGVSDAALATTRIVHGAQVWIDLDSPLLFDLAPTANGIGATEAPLPIPPDPTLASLQAFAQFAWPDPCLPGGMATSNALAVTIQP